jgi:2-keto-4-pentenoate hydratase/2-oxohepta-3-ene-1,7-dioic acid hydratase in catechol pathway
MPMRYATFSTTADPAPRPGVVTSEGRRLLDLASAAKALSRSVPPSVLDVIRHGEAAAGRIRDLLDEFGNDPAHTHAVDAVRMHAPIPRPLKNVICLGLNYAAHAAESSRARGKETRLPEVPVFFTKAPTSVTGPFDAVTVDAAVTAQVDWEVELAVVIGRGGRNIARADALRHVFGYTVINDLSARDLQTRHLQWFKGKSLDGFCPMGPVIVTADEFGDPQHKRLTSRVNGLVMQDSTTADMIFPIDAIIESLSHGLTLEPGDVIATGTPEGVGMGRTPPRFLNDGDVVEVEVEGIGAIRTRIAHASG